LKSNKLKSFLKRFEIAAWTIGLFFAGGLPQAKAQAQYFISPFFMPAGQNYAVGNLNLAMQKDGNFVLYRYGFPVWSTRTGGYACTGATCAATFQTDGNLVVYRQGLLPATSATYGQNLNMILSEAAPFVSMWNGRSTVWSGTGDFQNLTIQAGDAMKIDGTNLVFAMQTNGELILYKSGLAVWSTGTQGNCRIQQCSAKFQPDGMLVVYFGTTPYAYTKTAGPNRVLHIRDYPPYITITSDNISVWPQVFNPNCNYLVPNKDGKDCHNFVLPFDT
jgi:hypothetical protein